MTRTSERSQIARNAASSYAERALLMLSALLLTPYLFRTLGTGGFGTWSVMFAVTTVFSMLELGFSAGTTKFVAEQRARGRLAEVRQTLGVAVVLMGVLGLIALAVSVAVALLAPGLAAGGEQDDFRNGMLVLGLAMLVRFPCVAYGAALTGYQRYDFFNAAQALATVGFAGGAVAAIELGGGVFGVALAWAGALAVGGLAFAVLMLRADRQLSLRPRAGTRAMRRRMFSFSSFALLADSMIFVGQRADSIIVAALRSASAAAPLAAASKLQSGLQALTLPVLNMLMPMAADLQARGRDEELFHRFALASRATLQLTLPPAVAIALFSNDIVDVWLGNEAPAVTASIIALLAVQTISLCAVPADKVLVGIGRVRLLGTLNSIEGLANLALSIVLVTMYGAVGAAIGTLVTTGLIGPVKFPIACRALGQSTRAFVSRSLGPALLSSLPALAAMTAVHLSLEPGLTRLALGSAAGLGLALAVGLSQLPPRALRDRFRDLAGPQPADSAADTP